MKSAKIKLSEQQNQQQNQLREQLQDQNPAYQKMPVHAGAFGECGLLFLSDM